ncbi:hypothetical protein GF340_06090 [Candidatus Peregrinibacteria bacterium]|nr:hypothetical protein [Candidatus Peregrinibacteria bacterium]
MALYATISKKEPDGTVDHTHVVFENQVMKLDHMLVSKSDYTAQSHSKVYTPQREFENMFRYFFPPEIYGQRFADYSLQGYSNNGG